MAKLKVDGDVWKVVLGHERPRPGYRLVLFFCQPTGQRPYRVAAVPEDRYGSQGDLDRMGKSDLLELYKQSTSMDRPVYRSDEVEEIHKGD